MGSGSLVKLRLYKKQLANDKDINNMRPKGLLVKNYVLYYINC